MKFFRPARVLALAALTAAASSAMAFEEDTHFQITYIVCRTAGFTAPEALTIAAADQGMDDSAGTVANSGITPHVPEEWMWHALDHDGNMGPAGVIARKEKMFKACETAPGHPLKLLGVFFHYQQDTWAHRHHHDGLVHSYGSYTTYNTPFGHAGAGHQPDRPPFDPETAIQSLEDQLKYAKAYLVDVLKRQPRAFVANYVPMAGGIDTGWDRDGKDFHQLASSGASLTARRFFTDVIRAQINSYGCSIDPMYGLHNTANEANLDSTRMFMQIYCFANAVKIGDTIVIPTTAEKNAQNLHTMTTAQLVAAGMPKT